MGELFQQRGIKVVALVTKAHSAASTSKRAESPFTKGGSDNLVPLNASPSID